VIEVLNTLSPYIGIAMLAIGVYVIYLTTEDEKKTRKSSKHKR
jgi:hypothetical protein